LAVDAGFEGLADAEEGEGEGGGGLAAGVSHFLDGGTGLVAGEDELALAGGEFGEAVFEGGIEVARGGGGGIGGEEIEEGVIEDMAVAGGIAAGGFDLEEGDGQGPGEEGLGGIVFGGFAPEEEGGFLDDVIGEHAIGQQRVHVPMDGGLMRGDQGDHGLLGIGWSGMHGVREDYRETRGSFGIFSGFRGMGIGVEEGFVVFAIESALFIGDKARAPNCATTTHE
jgi:hypothetical protein